MFVYLFVWGIHHLGETLGIPETPEASLLAEGDQQEHQQETNERKNALVHMSLIDTPAGAPQGDERHQQEHQRKARCNYL